MTDTRRSTMVFIRGMVLMFAAVLVAGCSLVEKHRHTKILDRIAKHLNDRNPNPTVSSGSYDVHVAAFGGNSWPKPEEARAILIRHLGVSLHNEFWHWDRCDRTKLRAVLDQLEANGGADLNTVEGCLQIFELMLQVTSTARAYGPFAQILSAQTLGTFPKPGGLVEKTP